jgi:hypothetical protein
MRMTASWSGSNDPTAYKSVARNQPNGELPSDPQHRQAPTRARSHAKARLAVHHRSACSGVKALRNTSDARRQAAKLCYRFGHLTPSARSANLIAGTLSTTQNNRLTGKAPYRFESLSLQRRVSELSVPQGAALLTSSWARPLSFWPCDTGEPTRGVSRMKACPREISREAAARRQGRPAPGAAAQAT